MKRVGDPSAPQNPGERTKFARRQGGTAPLPATVPQSEASSVLDRLSPGLAAVHSAAVLPRAPSPFLHPPVVPDKMTAPFRAGREHWLKSPLSATWESADSRISQVLQRVNTLYHTWSKKRAPPFSPLLNLTALSTVSLLRKLGLPWFTNGILPPTVPAGNWPFHFKSFERAAVVAKGERVGDANPDGYVCTESEAHHYGLRALAQQTRMDGWNRSPTIVSSDLVHEGVASAADKLGLAHTRLPVNADGGVDARALQGFLEMHAHANPNTPIVFAASLGNEHGAYDDLRAVHAALEAFTARTGVPAYIHLDASRTFDDLTTMDDTTRRTLGLPAFHLGGATQADSIPVASVAAGGMNATYPAKVVALKPRALGGAGREIDYVMGPDSTVSGSRDALAGLVVALQEQRFGRDGIRALCAQSRAVRDGLANALRASGYDVKVRPGSLDLILAQPHGLSDAIVHPWGLQRLRNGDVMLTVQPGAQADDAQRLLRQLAPHALLDAATPLRHQDYAVSNDTLQAIAQTVREWRERSRQSGGYPGNQATYSILGPVLGRMLSKAIPQAWADEQDQKLIDDLKRRLGVSPEAMVNYQGGMVSGSTEGNGVVLRTALAQYPHAYVYLSKDTHYSGMKVLGDNAHIMRYNEPGQEPHYAEIDTDELGHMLPEAFAQRLVDDRARAAAAGEPFQKILLCNFGTTFKGATDNLQALFDAAAAVGERIDFVHGDGALMFGAGLENVRLGPPGSPARDPDTGQFIINGLTMSNHKFPGLMVSAQAVTYVPPGGRVVGLDAHADPRAVLDLWLYHELVTPEDLAAERAYCMDNATALRKGLERIGVGTLFNAESFITLLARQPPWFINSFHLSPEKNWLHFITMPHVNADMVQSFTRALQSHKDAVDRAVASASAAWSEAFGQPITVRPLECRDEQQMDQVRALLRRNRQPVNEEQLLYFARSAMSFVAHDGNGNAVGAYLLQATAKQLPDRLERRVEPMVVSTDADIFHENDARADAQEAAVGDALQNLLGNLVRAHVIDGHA